MGIWPGIQWFCFLSTHQPRWSSSQTWSWISQDIHTPQVWMLMEWRDRYIDRFRRRPWTSSQHTTVASKSTTFFFSISRIHQVSQAFSPKWGHQADRQGRWNVERDQTHLHVPLILAACPDKSQLSTLNLHLEPGFYHGSFAMTAMPGRASPA